MTLRSCTFRSKSLGLNYPYLYLKITLFRFKIGLHACMHDMMIYNHACTEHNLYLHASLNECIFSILLSVYEYILCKENLLKFPAPYDFFTSQIFNMPKYISEMFVKLKIARDKPPTCRIIKLFIIYRV